MSELITDLNEVMPNFSHQSEGEKWLAGKPTRAEMFNVINKLEQDLNSRMNKDSNKMAQNLVNIFSIARLNGMEISTLVRMFTKAIPEFDKNFQKELSATREMVVFLDSVMGQGEHSKKTIREKIQLIRDWNAREDVVKIVGANFGLDTYIASHMEEFTDPEELKKLAEDFEMEFLQEPPKITVVSEEVKDEVPNGS